MTNAATEEIIQQHTQAIEDVTLSVASLTQALQSEAKRATESDDLQSERTKSAEAAANDAKGSVSAHEARKDNPHGVTAEQLSLAAVATSGKYEDLTGLPKIPTALTDLTNAEDGGFITSKQACWVGAYSYVSFHGDTIEHRYLKLPQGEGSAKSDSLSVATLRGTQSLVSGINATFALKDEPVFTDWRDGTCVKVGKDAKVAEKDADGASVVSATALGANSYTATSGSLAVAQTPDAILLNSKTTDSGASAKTLRAYFDEKADATDLSDLSETVSALSAKVDEANAALEEVV